MLACVAEVKFESFFPPWGKIGVAHKNYEVYQPALHQLGFGGTHEIKISKKHNPITIKKH